MSGIPRRWDAMVQHPYGMTGGSRTRPWSRAILSKGLVRDIASAQRKEGKEAWEDLGTKFYTTGAPRDMAHHALKSGFLR